MEKQARILRKKGYLYLTEFFAGMAVMAVELGASRLLAPYFSSSQIVWTIIISTIMIAMALGNLYGGRSADKDPDPDRLYRRLLIASVWIAAIPALGKYIILLITGLLIVTISHQLLVIAGFLACMVLFVFPCFLLGTVTPSLARYTVQNLEGSGRVVGTLGAFNTIGSILGTFLPTFVTIPAVGTAMTFLLFSAVLLVLALFYFFSVGRRRVGCLVALVLYVLCLLFGNRSHFAFWEKTLAYEGESVYNYLQVKEDEQNVILSTNVLFGVQSILKKDDSLSGMYYDYAMAAPLFAGVTAEEEGDLLILGMGTGTYARQCLRFFPRLRVEGVEIDDKITQLARTYFDEPEEAVVTTYDGRAYLQATEHRYDVIMVDAFQDITIPFQMASTEFFTLVREHLYPDGVMVVNMNMRADGEETINAYLQDTIATIFPYVATVDVEGYTNRILFASEQPLQEERLREGASAASVESAGSVTLEQQEQLGTLMQHVAKELVTVQEGRTLPATAQARILTDDKAPVEVLSMRAIDQIIAQELIYYKEVFRRDGLQGILQAM